MFYLFVVTVSVIYFCITQITPKHNGKNQITCVFSQSWHTCRNREDHSLGSPACQQGCFKGTLFCLPGFLTTRGRDAHFIGRKNILWGLYVFKKLKSSIFFLNLKHQTRHRFRFDTKSDVSCWDNEIIF